MTGDDVSITNVGEYYHISDRESEDARISMMMADDVPQTDVVGKEEGHHGGGRWLIVARDRETMQGDDDGGDKGRSDGGERIWKVW